MGPMEGLGKGSHGGCISEAGGALGVKEVGRWPQGQDGRTRGWPGRTGPCGWGGRAGRGVTPTTRELSLALFTAPSLSLLCVWGRREP